MAKQLPSNITSYDLLKALAVMLMLSDHIGFWFFEDQNWWRVFGRLCVPIWFFLIGYAKSRDLSPRLWIGGALLVGASMLTGEWILPLNILFTMIIVRLVLDPIMRVSQKGEEPFMGICVALLCLVLPSYMYWEYGTQAIIMAMFGYMVRNKPEIGEIRDQQIIRKLFALFVMAQYILIQGVLFGFDAAQLTVFAFGTFAVMHVLYYFQPVEYSGLTAKLPGFVTGTLQFMGRKTLEIYVAHLILFKFLVLWVDPERFQFLHWSLKMP